MRKAAIDIGTNSTRLLIAEVNGKIKRLEKITTITRLGAGVDRWKALKPESIEKNVNTLLRYKEIAQSYGIEGIVAIATSAVRDASNREEFVRTIKNKTGIDVNVISGEEEARLGFIGATSSSGDGLHVVVDIGGGSTEFIAGNGSNIKILKSIDIGAVRITERFLPSDSIEGSCIIDADKYIRNMISEIRNEIKSLGDFKLVGVGGTITTLAAVDQELATYDIDRVHNYALKKDNINAAFRRFLSVSLDDRKCIPGLQPERADIIVAGTLILKIIMEEIGAGYIVVSEQDNLDGMLVEYSSRF